ncbi:hypothetical protein GCM10025794_34500 [Massilia kyonggiensis]
MEWVICHTARIVYLVQPGETSAVQVHDGPHSSRPLLELSA